MGEKLLHCTHLPYQLDKLILLIPTDLLLNTVKAMAYKRADKTIDSDYSNHGKNYTIKTQQRTETMTTELGTFLPRPWKSWEPEYSHTLGLKH